jgi:hypothetical protein
MPPVCIAVTSICQIELLLKSQESTTLQAFPDVEIFLDSLFPVRRSID